MDSNERSLIPAFHNGVERELLALEGQKLQQPQCLKLNIWFSLLLAVRRIKSHVQSHFQIPATMRIKTRKRIF